MKILFALDGSAGSFDAVAQVAPLLAHGRHEVALYCSPPSIRRASRVTSPEVLARAKHDLVEAVFEEARLRLPEPLRAGTHAITSTEDPRQAIVGTAEDWGANLIVVGARGLSTLERLLLGSVSRAVVHLSKIPVWVARTPPSPPAHRGVNILLACETPELGCRPAEILQTLAWPPGSKCRTLTVVPSMFAGKVPDWLQQQARSPDVEAMVQAWAREHDEELRAMRARMSEFCAKLPPVCEHCEPEVGEGEPAEVILAAIKREQIDVVVLGHYRKNWLTSTLLGRTSEAVLNHAPCSVVIVPHQEAG
jgi:nucleotide-binding universal stress UspA family protein